MSASIMEWVDAMSESIIALRLDAMSEAIIALRWTR
jgi:hypothetical protein